MISPESPHSQRPRSFGKDSFVYGWIQHDIFSREKLGWALSMKLVEGLRKTYVCRIVIPLGDK